MKFDAGLVDKTKALCEKKQVINNNYILFFSSVIFCWKPSLFYWQWQEVISRRVSAALEVIYLVTHLFLLSCIIFRPKLISEEFMLSDPIRGFYGFASMPCHFCISTSG